MNAAKSIQESGRSCLPTASAVSSCAFNSHFRRLRSRDLGCATRVISWRARTESAWRSVRLRQESAHHSHSSILDTNTRTLLTEGQNSGRPIQFLMRTRLVPQCVLLISYVTASTADSTQLAGSLEGSPLTLIPASQVLASNQHPLQCKTRRKIMKTRTLVVGRLSFQAPTLILTSTRSLQIRQAVYSRFRRLSGTSIA